MIGKTISHFKILQKLGEGGMGEVYLAEDTELDRKVALKFLPPPYTTDPEIKARFKREAKAAAALNHPNIITIHEIGEHEGQSYIAMEYVDGESLKELISQKELSLSKVIEIASQICEGLQVAHQAGIVHRDIKPANILLEKAGRVKIVDFGLAKLKDMTKLTRESSTMGTLSYMSPEQLQSADVDHRSDIFSFGVVLYEMITGQLPFKGEYEAAVSYSILNEEPEPLARYKAGVSQELQQIVDKALRKDVDTRYQHIDDLLADLKRERKRSSEPSQPSFIKEKDKRSKRLILRPSILLVGVATLIAILSYGIYSHFFSSTDNRGFVQKDEKFVILIAPFWGIDEAALQEGKVMQALVERKINQELGQATDVEILGKDIQNIPRSHDEAQALGKKLDATLVIWGEVLVLHSEVEIQPHMTMIKRLIEPFGVAGLPSAQVMQANLAEPNQLTFRKTKATEIGDVALLIAGRYYFKNGDTDRARSLYQKILPPTSHSLAMQGDIYIANSEWKKAEQLYKKALMLDSTNTMNHLRLGWLYFWQNNYETAIEKVQKAIALDPNVAEAYKALGWIYQDQGKYDEAIVEYQKAIRLDPKSSDLHHGLGWGYSWQGNYDEAIIEFQKAIKLNQEHVWSYLGLGRIYRKQGRYDEAIAVTQRAIFLNPNEEGGHRVLGNIYRDQGKYKEAIAEYQKAIELAPNHPYTAYSELGEVYFRLGKYDEAIAMIKKYMEIAPFFYLPDLHRILGNVYHQQGRYDEAIAEYQKAIKLSTNKRFIPYYYLFSFIALHQVGKDKEAQAYINEFMKNLEGNEWIISVARFYAGEITEEAVLKAAENKDPVKEKEQKCEAFYYLGMAHLLNIGSDSKSAAADTAKASDYFKKCLATELRRFWEYGLAKAELQRLQRASQLTIRN